MKRILLTITLTLVFGGLSTFAATDTTGLKKTNVRFAKLEATETSWDYTSIIYSVVDAEGNEVKVNPSQIQYEVRDKSGNDISTGKGIFVSLNDTKMESEEDYSITISAYAKKEWISQTIYRKASPKKLILKDKGIGYSYKVMRPKYSSPTDYENLNVNTSSMSVDVAIASCKNCPTFKVGGNAAHTTLTDENSYRTLESTIKDMTQRGKNVQLILQPTVNQKNGTSMRYAQSYYEITPNAIREVEAEPATADKDGGEE